MCQLQISATRDGTYPPRVQVSGAIIQIRCDSEIRLDELRNWVFQAINEKIGVRLPPNHYIRGTNTLNEPNLVRQGTFSQSTNHATKQQEDGISVSGNLGYIQRHHFSYGYFIKGTPSGKKGSDGEDVLLPGAAPVSDAIPRDLLMKRWRDLEDILCSLNEMPSDWQDQLELADIP